MVPPSPSLSSAAPMSHDIHAEAIRRVQKRFSEMTGQEATHLAFAPGRVNLIGEHTDYNGGFVLPLAIEPGIYVAARLSAQGRAKVWSTQQSQSSAEFDVTGKIERGEPAWSNYVRGVVAGMKDAGVAIPGFDAVIDATLPAGGGLSSSAALEVATATLLESLTGTALDSEKKALICQKAEHEFAGTPCGIMDQFAVTFGKRGQLLLLDCRSRERRLIAMRGTDVQLLVINTMVKHELTDGGYASRREDCHEAARLLGVPELRDCSSLELERSRTKLPDRLYRRARHVTTENERTLAAVESLQAGRWEELGGLMYGSHASLRDDFEVSCSELDVVVQAARDLGLAHGIYGCRMTGGGFGGCCIALVRTERAGEVAKELRARYARATGLEPTIFSTAPADGTTVLPLP